MDHFKSKHADLPRDQWWVNPEAGDASCSVNEPDPHAAAKVIAKVVAASIHPSASKPVAPVEKTYPGAEAPKRPREEEEEEGGTTTDSDVVIVEAKTTAPMPKKRKE